MCLSCGCGEPDEDHGDRRHITRAMLQEAAKAGEVNVDQAAHNIVETLHKAQAKPQTSQRPRAH